MEPRTVSRATLGPLIVGVAAWCALGNMSVLTPDDPSIRVVVPASWIWFPVATLAAALVPGWRRHPLTATPALLATVSWWPVGVPALALVWTGAMAWVPIGLAALAAAMRVRPSTVPSTTGSPLASAALAAALTVVVAIFAAWSLSPRIPGGDEPHYLIITQSLLQDRDIQIENNHTARDYAAYYSGDARPDFKIRGQNGAIYSIHAPGTAVVVLPAFAMFGYRGAQATIVLLVACASAFMWYAAWLATGDRRAAWVAWLAVVGTPTFVIQSVTIFPDSIGIFIVAATITSLLRLSEPRQRPLATAGLVGTSALLALLPWLHTRFAVLAAGLGIVVAWFIMAEPEQDPTQRKRRLALFAVVPIVSALAWFGFFQIVYGTPNPIFPYGEDRGTSLTYVPGGLLGLFFDAQFGLLAYSPILAAAVIGLFVGHAGQSNRTSGLARATFVVGLTYLAASASYWMWWAGVPAPPARFAAAVLPAFVIPVALAWSSAGAAMRAVWTTLLSVSVATTAVVIGAARARIAWNTRGIRANWLDWLSGVTDLSRAWPSFFWGLSPTDLTTELHFLKHVVIWAAIFTATCVVLLRWLRNRSMASAGLPVVWWLSAAVMLAVQAGWSLSGSTGLNPASSQITVLNAAASGRRVLQVRPFAIGPLRDLTGRLRIRATRADEVGESTASWMPLLEVPPGEFGVTVGLRRPREGTLALRIGRSLEPLRRLTVAGVSTQTLSLALPAGAGALFFEPDAGLSSAGDRIELTPVKLQAPVTGFAATSARFGDADLFFYGPTIFPEPDGFWVRGGQTTTFTVAVEHGLRGVNLAMTNGQAVNDVRLEWNTRKERVALRPFESRTITVDVSRDGVALVHLTSTAGFRPSDDGISEDHRYLGVRVKVE